MGVYFQALLFPANFVKWVPLQGPKQVFGNCMVIVVSSFSLTCYAMVPALFLPHLHSSPRIKLPCCVLDIDL